MLTSFFRKSAPINYLIIGIVIIAGYILAQDSGEIKEMDVLELLKHIGFSGVVVFSMLLLDFIIRKNNLTKKNTYGILIFAGFLLMVPSIFKNRELMLALVFCLLALRRVFSFTSEKNIEKKILDASLWIALAMFFYFYSLFFFVPVYYAILRRPHASYRHFFIPPIGILITFILIAVFHLFMGVSFNWIYAIVSDVSLDFSAYNSLELVTSSALILVLLMWVGFYRLLRVSSIMRKGRTNYILLLVVLITGLVVAIAAPEKDGSELFFILPPLAIATTDYLENRENRLIKEIFLWIIVLLPVGRLFI